jgi:hypothetical protein
LEMKSSKKSNKLSGINYQYTRPSKIKNLWAWRYGWRTTTFTEQL